MAVAAPPDFSEGTSAAGSSRPAAVARLFATMAGEGRVAKIGWTLLSIGLFAGIWEFLWAIGWADPKLLPPPHIFMGSIVDQAKFFNTATRWQVGRSMTGGPSAFTQSGGPRRPFSAAARTAPPRAWSPTPNFRDWPRRTSTATGSTRRWRSASGPSRATCR